MGGNSITGRDLVRSELSVYSRGLIFCSVYFYISVMYTSPEVIRQERDSE